MGQNRYPSGHLWYIINVAVSAATGSIPTATYIYIVVYMYVLVKSLVCVLMCVVHGIHFCIHSTATKNVAHKLFRCSFIYFLFMSKFSFVLRVLCALVVPFQGLLTCRIVTASGLTLRWRRRCCPGDFHHWWPHNSQRNSLYMVFY